MRRVEEIQLPYRLQRIWILVAVFSREKLLFFVINPISTMPLIIKSTDHT